MYIITFDGWNNQQILIWYTFQFITYTLEPGTSNITAVMVKCLLFELFPSKLEGSTV